MGRFLGYLRTVRNYWNDNKGHHDIVDYSRALIIMLLSMAAAYYLLYWEFSLWQKRKEWEF